MFNNDTDQESGVWSHSTGCEKYIPLEDAHNILCDKECFDNNFIALGINICVTFYACSRNFSV